MIKSKIPEAKTAFIGGSSTFAIEFPENLKAKGVKVLQQFVVSTPFGESPEFKLFTVNDRNVLTVKMHGWRTGTNRADASKQIFWVFHKAGVKTILTEGGVGTISKDIQLRDFFIPDDYLDFSMRKDVHLYDKYLLVMRHPICQELTRILTRIITKLFPDRQVMRGIYAVTDGRHFESRAEVRMIEKLGGDVIGQSLCPEVYLAREIGACYAGIYLIVNRAEGIEPQWSYKELKDIFYNEALNVGKIIIESIKSIIKNKKQSCQCSNLRKRTLLKYKKVS
ncbi:MAG: MTAP family purine nucleoside phosphorylase [Nitrospirae bacterium]|nr:MTAP family purine nucleoside phosphorylase [Nitrospirota bacterium]